MRQTPGATLAGTIRDGLARADASPWFAYLALLLLQLKVIWGMWQFRDLPSGDTASYFVRAYAWFLGGKDIFALSPLYTWFYGNFLYLSTDAYLATTAHRMVIVLALAALLLAVFRRILPAGIAWLAAAWWVVLPTMFDAAYEVHLFSAIPPLAAWLAILAIRGPRGRGLAVAILLAGSLLVRNELFVATAAVGLAMAWWEAAEWRRGRGAQAREYVTGYVLPLALVVAATLFFYARSQPRFPELWGVFRRKHTLNICQVYAFGYLQRHADWHGSPWTGCQSLMERDFGHPEPALLEALRRNPRAMLEHFRWNASLIPNGLQVLVFHATSGKANPDYYPVRPHSREAAWLSALLGFVVVAGGWRLWRDWDFWWKQWLQPAAGGWLTMGCAGLTSLLAMLTQRPRPSYLFAFGASLMAAAALCAAALVGARAPKRPSALFPLAALALIAIVPRHFDHGARPLLESYRRMAPFAAVLERPGTVFLTPNREELCDYVRRATWSPCTAMSFFALRGMKSHGAASWPEMLDRYGINVVYADEAVLEDGSIHEVLENPGAFGWETIGLQRTPQQQWVLLARKNSVVGWSQP